MKKNTLVFMSFVFVSVLVGCAHSVYNVQINSISGGGKVCGAYILVPGMKGVNSDDLQFKEFSTYVKWILNLNRCFHTEPQYAGIAVFMAYGIGDPKVEFDTLMIPQFGQTGVSSTTKGTVRWYGTYGSYEETTTFMPEYGIVGFKKEIIPYTTFLRFLILEAIDLEEFKRSGKVVQLWRTTVVSRGKSGDLRQVFPILAAAARPYIGRSTGKVIEVKLTEKDALKYLNK